MFFEAVLDFVLRLLFELVWTPLFYGPGWLVCFLTPFWRKEARALVKEPFYPRPGEVRRDPLYSNAANQVAFIGFCAVAVIGGAVYAWAHFLRA